MFRGLPPCDEDTGTYCDARKRLPTAVVRRLVHETARRGEAEAPDSWLWKGRRVYLVDGTTVSMPDTPANQAAFPQPRTQRRGLGFPIARLAVLIALWTGLARDLAMGPYKGKETGETALFRKMLDALKRGRCGGRGPLFRLVFHAGGAIAAGRRWGVPDAPEEEVRLPSRADPGAFRSRRGMDQASTAGLDERSRILPISRRDADS